MKARLKSIFGVSTLTLLLTLTPVVAIAQGAEEPTTNATTPTTTTQTTSPNPAELKSRLDKRKAELRTRVDSARQARIKSRCQASQGKLSSVSGRIKGLETSRAQVYANLVSRLEKLSQRLGDKGLDVATLNEQITQLKTAVEAFNTSLTDYKQSVADLAAMDCVADPTAFQASLVAARAARVATAERAKEIRTLLSDTIKPTLVDLKSQLATVDTTENEENN